MGSVGDCFGNAMCESFYPTLECELLARRRFKTQAEARMALFELIEGWGKPAPASFRDSTIAHRIDMQAEDDTDNSASRLFRTALTARVSRHCSRPSTLDRQTPPAPAHAAILAAG
jgi:hypothetical protein